MAPPELESLLNGIAPGAPTRLDFWEQFLNAAECKTVAEIGVWKGEFAEHILANCPQIQQYVMIDPWRHLDNWNKPFNYDQEQFAAIYHEALQRTEFAASKRRVLRGRTIDVIEEVPDQSLDFVYVDGDHTLRGITMDLIRSFGKVKVGGFLCGDDFSPTIWGHTKTYEPTLVCPFAVYFAEAIGAAIYGLPMNQFLIHKEQERYGGAHDYRFIDLAGTYGDLSLLKQF